MTFRNENIQEATLEGIEAAVDWRLHPQWSVWANHSSPRGSDELTGEPLPSVPPDRTALGVDWSSAETGLRAGLAARIAEEEERAPEGLEPMAGYTLFDLHVSWTPRAYQDVTFRFGVDNLAGEDYTVPVLRMPGSGRDVRTGVSFRFGR